MSSLSKSFFSKQFFLFKNVLTFWNWTHFSNSTDIFWVLLSKTDLAFLEMSSLLWNGSSQRQKYRRYRNTHTCTFFSQAASVCCQSHFPNNPTLPALKLSSSPLLLPSSSPHCVLLHQHIKLTPPWSTSHPKHHSLPPGCLPHPNYFLGLYLRGILSPRCSVFCSQTPH